MKKLLTLTAVGAILAVPASAVQKCVPWVETTCRVTADSYSVQWSGVCNETNVAVSGLGLCSTSSNTSTDVRSSIGALGGLYCYCKALQPMPSKWVYVHTYDDLHICQQSCASACAQFMGIGSFVESVFKTMAAE
ncbi:MAG: hypothetical protein IKB05_04940 [Alphaproteobacteria bacterium]|nr:hypothetical protein [Alphaproteobacteria bacterium]